VTELSLVTSESVSQPAAVNAAIRILCNNISYNGFHSISPGILCFTAVSRMSGGGLGLNKPRRANAARLAAGCMAEKLQQACSSPKPTAEPSRTKKFVFIRVHPWLEFFHDAETPTSHRLKNLFPWSLKFKV
jgi:hypothetical protein